MIHNQSEQFFFRPIFFLAICFLGLILLLNSCGDDPIFSGDQADIRFSVDTLRFDTVFTTQGSATRILKMYNRESEDVILDQVSMTSGSASFFRLNIDGTPTTSANDLIIPANDSLYIFAEVTINPDDPLEASPFIIEEYLEVRYRDQTESVLFEAWGQNANYLNSRDSVGRISFLTCDFGQFVFDDPRPYVVHGILVIDSCDVILPAGTDIYVHGGIAINQIGVYNDGLITVLSQGRIRSQGTAADPVIIQGDRLEPNFEDDPGQWVGVRFFNESTANILSHTTIKNSLIGIRADSASQVFLESCQILNTSTSGITAVHSDVSMENCLFYNNGTNAVQIVYGGDYELTHCTMYNDNNQDAALVATNFICLDEQCVSRDQFPLNLTMTNNIISGSNEDEIIFVDDSDGMNSEIWNVEFRNNLTRVEEILTNELYAPIWDDCTDCIVVADADSVFMNREEYDLRLDTLSIAIDKGILPGTQFDILGVERDMFPDLGCYEFKL